MQGVWVNHGPITTSTRNAIIAVDYNMPAELNRLARQMQRAVTRFHDDYGDSLLIRSIRKGRRKCAFVCLRYSGWLYDINEVSRRGHQSTALHLATRKGDYELVSELLRYGANVDIKDGHKDNAYRVVHQDGQRGLRMLLLGLWRRRKWSPSLHCGTPIDFQREVWQFICINWRHRWIHKDVVAIVLESLLNLHRREWDQPHSKRRHRRLAAIEKDKKARCSAQTKKGAPCKRLESAPGAGLCYQHAQVKQTCG